MDKIQPTILFVHFPYCLISNNDSFQDTINFYVALNKMLALKFNFHFKVIFVVKCELCFQSFSYDVENFFKHCSVVKLK